MQRAWRLIALGVAAYLLILVTTFPATRLTGMLQQRIPDLSVYNVSGSVFSGKAGQLVWQDLNLGTLHWQLRPLALLLGRMEYVMELTHPANSGQLTAGITLTGRAYIREMQLRLLPDRIVNHYSPVAVQSGGEMQLEFARVDVSDVFSEATSGRIAWQDAVILEPVNMVLGQLEMNVQGTGDALEGVLTQGGVLGAAGGISLVPGGDYRVDLVLQPGPDATPETLDLLEHSTRVQPDGSYQLQQSGRF